MFLRENEVKKSLYARMHATVYTQTICQLPRSQYDPATGALRGLWVLLKSVAVLLRNVTRLLRQKRRPAANVTR